MSTCVSELIHFNKEVRAVDKTLLLAVSHIRNNY